MIAWRTELKRAEAGFQTKRGSRCEMTSHKRVLLDGVSGIAWQDANWNQSNSLQFPGNADWSVKTSTLIGGTAQGVQLLEICTGTTTWSILPTRGMGIWKAELGHLRIGWNSPVTRPVHPAFVNLTERNGLGWLNGFNELLCRCGLAYQGPPGTDNGEMLTLHGRIANTPASNVELEFDATGTGAIIIRGIVEETTFFGPRYELATTYRFPLGEDRVEITDVISNRGARPIPLSLLYHINIGDPLLEAGATVTVPSRDIVPRDARSGALGANWNRYAAPEPGFPEEGFFFNPIADASGWSTAVLTNSRRNQAFAVRFKPDTLPWFTVWKNTMALEEGYVTGIEPGVNLPNLRSYERDHGRLPQISPGESYRCDLQLVIANSSVAVQSLQQAAANCQVQIRQTFHALPQPGWSPQGDSEVG